MRTGLTFPDDEKEEMMYFLKYGPGPRLGPAIPPMWIDWSNYQVREQVSADESEESNSSDESEVDDEYVPFLHYKKNPDGKLCRCGSDTHLTTNHRACRLRKRARPEPADSDEEDSPTSRARSEKFPYPVGTKVAMDFGDHGQWPGEIVELYEDDGHICRVLFTDGDVMDLDVEEIQYAIELYARDF